MSLPRTGIYQPPQQQQLQPPVLSVPQQTPLVNWPQVAAPPAQIAVQQQQQLQPEQQQQSHAYITAAAARPPVAPPQAMLPVLNAAPTLGKNQPADEEYDEYEEDKSTEPPKKVSFILGSTVVPNSAEPIPQKQRKHKKAKPKSSSSSKDPIELALEQNKQPQQQLPPPAMPVPVGPVHEQYKMIHDNLALEFRDHDGHSERPGGAVLSLTLGLLVTAALAILIGCRMRTVGRRARRMGGKTPYSQEADFLVNGMYL